MKVFEASKMKEMDDLAVNEFGIPLILLMNQAAEKLMEAIMKRDFKKCVIVCGNGNNGGDGLALATLLARFTKVEVRVALLCERNLISETSLVYLRMVEKLKIELLEQPSVTELATMFHQSEIIVDCIFGFGLNRKIEGYLYDCIECLNQQTSFVLSCDIPSGIGADDGHMYGIAVQADATVTFQNPKLGLYLQVGREACGTIEIADLGFPSDLIENLEEAAVIMDEKQLGKLLPKRKVSSHKGDYGKVLLIGGSVGMGGALKLAVKATLKMGCGLTYMAFPASLFPEMTSDIDEAMSLLCEEEQGHLVVSSRLLELANQCDVIAFGNGLGRSEAISQLLKELLKLDKPMVIDADGLWALKAHLSLLKMRKAETVLTPHDMELSRLMDCELSDLQANRYTYAKKFTRAYPITLVAKGMNTLILHGETVRINLSGNNSLSKGGSGDVLCGIISGLLAQNKDGFAAATLGVYLHGLSADINVSELNVYSSTPSDLITQLPKAINQLMKQEKGED